MICYTCGIRGSINIGLRLGCITSSNLSKAYSLNSEKWLLNRLENWQFGKLLYTRRYVSSLLVLAQIVGAGRARKTENLNLHQVVLASMWLQYCSSLQFKIVKL